MQSERLPKDVFEQLQATLEHGEALDPSLADAVAAGDEGVGAREGRHPLHPLVPAADRLDRREARLLLRARPARASALAEFSGKELIQGEPDASSFPTGGIRATFEARGYTAWDPTSPAFILENPNGALLCIPTAFASWTGEALDAKIPLLRSMDALSTLGDPRAASCSATTRPTRVFTTVGPEQEYFLIDEQYYFERPDLVIDRPHAVRRQAAQGPRARRPLLRLDPRADARLHASSPSASWRKLGVPVKTRHNEVAPGQYEIAPIFENSNVGSDHQQLTMQVHAERSPASTAWSACCTRSRSPASTARASTTTGRWAPTPATTCSSPGDTPRENTQFLFFCAAVIQAVNKHQGLLRASVADIGQDHRLGANEAPPAIISIFLGAELDEGLRGDRVGRGRPAHAERPSSSSAPTVLPPLPMHGGDRNRTSPFAFTGNKFEFRALGSSMSLAFPNTVLNTIVAEAIDELADELEAKLERRRRRRRGGHRGRQGRPTTPTSRSSSTATTTPRSGTPRPSSAG